MGSVRDVINGLSFFVLLFKAVGLLRALRRQFFWMDARGPLS